MFIKTHFSVLQSSLKVEETVKYIKEVGYKAIILADNNLFASLHFFYACKKEEILPIISVETEIDGDSFLFIAKNGEGFKDLSYISAKKERISSNNIFTVLLNTDKDKIEEIDFIANNECLLNREWGIPILPIHRPTHKTEQDYRVTNALMAINDKELLDKMSANGEGCNPEDYILSKEDFINSFPKKWIANLARVVKSCSVKGYNFGNPTPPHFAFKKELAKGEGLSEVISEEDLFAHMARKGLKKRLKFIESSKHKEYKERLEYEINIINNMKFPGYMLIVQDFVLEAKKMGIPVGPGRGSAAGSLVAYAMEITDIDPIPYGLLFERFLNPERVTMPDIDMDFCQDRRPEVLEYVAKKYGKEKVAQIITFGTLGAKGSINDISRVLGYPLCKATKFSKLVPEKPGITLEEAYKSNKKAFDKIIESEPEAKRVWEYAQKVEGLNRNLGVHAAGVVISDTPLWQKAPIADIKGTQVVGFEGGYLEDVDLIKFDFLGLKTLSVIKKAQELILRNHNKEISFENTQPNDSKVFEFISTGKTAGIFQIESDGMQSLCRRMKPSSFNDLIALIALYRPGPMESGMLEDYVNRKNGLEEVSYFFDEYTEILKPILEPTYGVIVYQEQVMEIVQKIGGFSLGEADIIRRAMGKKDIKYMEQKAKEFAEGAEKQGLNKENAIKLFNLIEKFAGYGFNKSHSAAYAMITYQTAFLKTYFPAEFLTALVHYDIKNQDKVVRYLNEAKEMGIKISKLDINSSPEDFDTDGETLFYGLSAIKGVGSGAKVCLQAREKKSFESFKDFITRTTESSPRLNKRVYEALASVGALDSFGIPRKFLLENSEEILKNKEGSEIWENISKEEFNLSEKLKMEKDKLGFYATDPFEVIEKVISKLKIPELSSLDSGYSKILIFPEELVIKKAKSSGKEFGILTGYYNGSSRDILCFKDKEYLESLDLSRPMILDISVKADGGIFLSQAKTLKTVGQLKAEFM